MIFIKKQTISFSSHPLRQSTRLHGFDYSQPGAYFITICIRKHKSLLGNVSNGVMVLNSVGEIVQSCLTEIPAYFPNTELSAYIIMPNHVHGIIPVNSPVGARHAVPECAKKLLPNIESFGEPVKSSLPTIVRSFKSAVTRSVNISRGNRQSSFWQRGYYEHVIRNEEELIQIGEYILGNPLKWEEDRENTYAMKKLKPLPFEY